jgi:hypothetical protein
VRATTILLGISYWQSIRDGADFLIGQCFHHSSPKSNSIGTDFWELNLTGPERRIAQLPDLVTLSLSNEGPTPILIMGMGR